MKDKSIIIKVSEEQHAIIKEKSKELGFDTMSEYLRYLALNTKEIKRIIK
jgi:hypothetical protein